MVAKVLLRSADRVADSIEQNPGFFLALFLFFYTIITLAYATRRFWYDELFTYYLCRLPSFSSIWAAVRDGVDFNPPLLYVVTRLTNRAFGYSVVATRLPAMLGFAIMSICVFLFVRRRCGLLYGFGAMCFPVITGAYRYAAEARAYGLVLAFCGLATVFWQSATEEKVRRFTLVALSASIAGCLMSHCYAILIFIPFSVAELVRLSCRRRPDWPLWMALGAPLACILIYLPMFHSVKGYTIDSISFRPGLSHVPRFYQILINPWSRSFEPVIWHQAVWPLLMVMVLVALAKPVAHRIGDNSDSSKIPTHEVAFLATLSLLPFFGQLLAQGTGTVFIDRYALSAVIGCSGLLAYFGFRVTGGNRRVATGMITIFLGWFVLGTGLWLADLFHKRPYDLPSVELASLPKEVPIVISNALTFLEKDYHETPAVASQLRFLTERSSALRYTGTDVFDRGYYTMRRWFPIKGQIIEYDAFLASNKHFFIYGPFLNPEDWVLRRIMTSGLRLTFRGQYAGPYGDNVLLEVNEP